VSPMTFTIEPGQIRAVDLTFEVPGRPAVEHVFGSIVLTNSADGRTIRLPVALLPNVINLVVPPASSDQSSGRIDATIESGFRGAVSAVATGLAAPDVQRGQRIGIGPLDVESVTSGAGLNVHDIDVPPGAQLLQVQLDHVDGTDAWSAISDLDLYVLHDGAGDGFQFPDDLVAASDDISGFESVGISDPGPGRYRVVVHRFGDFGPPIATYDFTSWIIADPSPDDLTSPAGPGVAATGDPFNVAPGDTATLPIDYARLSTPGTHLGIVTFYDTAVPSPRSAIESRLLVVHYDPAG
jgi:hypothetical protein